MNSDQQSTGGGGAGGEQRQVQLSAEDFHMDAEGNLVVKRERVEQLMRDAGGSEAMSLGPSIKIDRPIELTIKIGPRPVQR
jgi:hypothetical protein